MSDEEAVRLGPHELTRDQAEMIGMLQQDAVNRTLGGDPAAIDHSVASNPWDPAFLLLLDGRHTVPVVHQDGCYICGDPEYAIMGLPLCMPCPACARKMRPCAACSANGYLANGDPCSDCLASGWTGDLGHIPADDATCTAWGEEHGPPDYDAGGLITGIPPELAARIRDMGER